MCPDFVLSRTPQFISHKHTSERLFTEQVPVAAFKCPLFFQKGKNRKKNFIPLEAVVLRYSVNKSVPNNSTKFTGKHLCQSLSFNKFAGLRLWHKCFLVNFVKISRPPFLKKTSRGCFYSSSVLDTLETLQMHQNWNPFHS